MKEHPCAATEDFWRRVDEAGARALVANVTGAVRAHVRYARALGASRRAAVLLGEGKEGCFHELEAETYYGKRNSQLRSAKYWFAKIVEDADEGRKKLYAEFLNRGGLDDLAAHARRTAVLHLLKADVTAEDAGRAVKQFDGAVEKLRELKSLDDANGYLQRHLDGLLGKEMGNPNPNGFCILLLLITSLLIILIMIAALICVFTFGLACDGILDQLIANACGSS